MRLKHRLLSMAPEFLVSFVCGEGVLRIGTNNKFPGDAHTASPGSMLRESWRKSRIWVHSTGAHRHRGGFCSGKKSGEMTTQALCPWLANHAGTGTYHRSLSLLSTSVYQKRLPWWLSGEESVCNAGDQGSIPGSGRTPGRQQQPTPVFLPGESHEQKSLAGYSLWGGREMDMTEVAEHACTCIRKAFSWYLGTYCKKKDTPNLSNHGVKIRKESHQ